MFIVYVYFIRFLFKVLGDVFCNSPSRVEVTTPHRDFRWDEESENLVFAPLDEVQLKFFFDVYCFWFSF